MKPVVHLPGIEGLFCGISPCAHDCLTLHQLSESLGNAVDAKDRLTHNHSQYVAVISYLIALAMGFNAKQADVIHIAGHLHDIGKIGIPDSVLKKTGSFTEQDWEWMRRHPEIGAKIVSPVKFFKSNGGVREIVLYHHERYDGMGYPHNLQGSDIPIGARIVAVADTLSALIQDRPYRKGRDFDAAVEEIRRGSGSQFDPVVVRVFVEIKDNIKQWMEGV
ncbi:HD-GYP domain-containing protein [Dissulfurispira sp.]|uniref:HD-GYP domain-containing protein n=1 Tax=Dissulfurispira sp. TaxID=2817609 RepID=UPI002FD90E29